MAEAPFDTAVAYSLGVPSLSTCGQGKTNGWHSPRLICSFYRESDSEMRRYDLWVFQQPLR
jgi:hypothetical protein